MIAFAGNDLFAVRRESDRKHGRRVRADARDQFTPVGIPQTGRLIVARRDDLFAIRLEGDRFLRFRASSFGHVKEDTLLPL
jgi:hypothetical protein